MRIFFYDKTNEARITSSFSGLTATILQNHAFFQKKRLFFKIRFVWEGVIHMICNEKTLHAKNHAAALGSSCVENVTGSMDQLTAENNEIRMYRVANASDPEKETYCLHVNDSIFNIERYKYGWLVRDSQTDEIVLSGLRDLNKLVTLVVEGVQDNKMGRPRPQEKYIPSAGWLSPDGRFFPCDRAEHDDLAVRLNRYLVKRSGVSDVTALEEAGWLRVDSDGRLNRTLDQYVERGWPYGSDEQLFALVEMGKTGDKVWQEGIKATLQFIHIFKNLDRNKR